MVWFVALYKVKCRRMGDICNHISTHTVYYFLQVNLTGYRTEPLHHSSLLCKFLTPRYRSACVPFFVRSEEITPAYTCKTPADTRPRSPGLPSGTPGADPSDGFRPPLEHADHLLLSRQRVHRHSVLRGTSASSLALWYFVVASSLSLPWSPSSKRLPFGFPQERSTRRSFRFGPGCSSVRLRWSGGPSPCCSSWLPRWRWPTRRR